MSELELLVKRKRQALNKNNSLKSKIAIESEIKALIKISSEIESLKNDIRELKEEMKLREYIMFKMEFICHSQLKNPNEFFRLIDMDTYAFLAMMKECYNLEPRKDG